MVYGIAIDLNLARLDCAFLCFEKPMVLNIIAIILIKGCSKAYNRKLLSFIATEKDCTLGDVKYKNNPKSICICVKINPKRAIFLSFPTNSLLDENPIIALIAAKANKINTA